VRGTFGPSGKDGGEPGCERFSFPGGHFRQPAVMQGERAGKLDGKCPQLHRAEGGFADCGQRRQEQVIGGTWFAPEMFAEFQELCLQMVVVEIGE
jgi:hypothetical protein